MDVCAQEPGRPDFLSSCNGRLPGGSGLFPRPGGDTRIAPKIHLPAMHASEGGNPSYLNRCCSFRPSSLATVWRLPGRPVEPGGETGRWSQGTGSLEKHCLTSCQDPDIPGIPGIPWHNSGQPYLLLPCSSACKFRVLFLGVAVRLPCTTSQK